MAIGWQKGTLFAAGILLGCGLGAWAVVGPLHAVHGPVAAPRAQDDAAAAAQTIADVKVASGPLRCDLGPIAPKAGAGDGQTSLQTHPTGASASEVAAQLLAGKEAEASGHQRDAEVAFLNACHSAQVVPGHDDSLVADADYQLARLYANLAIAGGPRAAELRQRAEQLYGASLNAYRTRYGAGGEKTRFATEGLARLEKSFEGGGTTQVASSEPEGKAAAETHVNAAPEALPKPRETTVVSAPAHSEPLTAARRALAAVVGGPRESDADGSAPAEVHVASPQPEVHVAAPRRPQARVPEPQPPKEHVAAPPSAEAGAPAPHSWETRAAVPQGAHDTATPVYRARETMAAVPLAQRTQSAASAQEVPAAAAAPASAVAARQARDRENQRARDGRSDTRNATHVATGDAHRPHASAPTPETDDEEIIIVRPVRRPRMDIDGGPGASLDDEDALPPRWRRHADEDDEQ